MEDIKKAIQEEFSKTNPNEATHKLNLFVVINCLFERVNQLETKIEDVKNGNYICAFNERNMLINDAKSRKLELEKVIKLLLVKSNSL